MIDKDSIPRCDYCRARLDFVTPWNQPHICKETIYSTFVSPTPILPVTGE